jgi:hypothetical protein
MSRFHALRWAAADLYLRLVHVAIFRRAAMQRRLRRLDPLMLQRTPELRASMRVVSAATELPAITPLMAKGRVHALRRSAAAASKPWLAPVLLLPCLILARREDAASVAPPTRIYTMF